MIQAIRARLCRRTKRLRAAVAHRTVRRFARGKDGIAAVEFGMVAAPFLALMFAIMETAIVFFAGQTLETAVADSARLIMTGQAQTAGLRPGAVQERGLRARSTACSIAPSGIYDRREELLRRSPVDQHRQADRRQRQSADRISAISPAGPATSWWCG